MDIHLARGFLEPPLAPNFPVRVRRIGLTARWSDTWATRSALRCVRAVGVVARFRDVGSRRGDGAPLYYRILSPYGRWYRLGVWIQAGDRVSCRWALGLGVVCGVVDWL